MKQPSHTISIYVANKPGVLMRVAQVFARRGFNIDSLVVSPGQREDYSRMTLTVTGAEEDLIQILKAVTKLIDVLHATDHGHQTTIERELALIKVETTEKTRPDILSLVSHFKGQTLDFSDASLVIQVTGSTEKIDAMMALLAPYSILEVVRTGKVVIARGKEET